MSIVQICNIALSKLGQQAINSLTEDSPVARYCSIFYDPIKDEVLRGHNWNFAGKRVSLAPVSDAPVFGYSYAFNLPADCIKVRYLNDSAISWTVEGRTILANTDSINVVYTSRIEDTTLFDPFFISVLATRLAAELAVPITSSATLGQNLFKSYQIQLDSARAADARENNSSSDLNTETATGDHRNFTFLDFRHR